MFIGLLAFVIFMACFVSMMYAGLWSNTLTLVNVITSGLLATNYFEPLADYFDKQNQAGHYVWDFLAIWLIFGVSMLVLRALTDFVSQVKVKFFMPVDKAGGILMAVWASWVVVCFSMMTFHTAPLSRNFMGFQIDPTDRMVFGIGPDRLWLSWVQRESKGPLCRFDQIVPFDASGDFILRYGERRDAFDQQMGLTKSGGP